MYKLKQFSQVVCGTESLKDELEFIQLNDSLESDITTLEHLRNFDTLTSNIHTYGMESVALMQLAGKMLGVTDTNIGSMESCINAVSPSVEGFADKAKKVVDKIIEKLKAIWAWIKSKLGIGEGKVEAIQKEILSLSKPEARSVDALNLTIVDLGTEDDVPDAIHKLNAADSNAKRVASSGMLLLEKKELHIPSEVAAWFNPKLLDGATKYLTGLHRLVTKTALGGAVKGKDLLDAYKSTLEPLSTGRVSDNWLDLDILPLSPTLRITWPELFAGKLAGSVYMSPLRDNFSKKGDTNKLDFSRNLDSVKLLVDAMISIYKDMRTIYSRSHRFDDVVREDIYRLQSEQLIGIVLLDKIITSCSKYVKYLSAIHAQAPTN